MKGNSVNNDELESGKLISKAYISHSRPGQGSKLEALGLDVAFHKGDGNYLYYFDDNSKEIAVLDCIQGYGSGLFGHNYKDFVDDVIGRLSSKEPFMNQFSAKRKAALLSEYINHLLMGRFGKQYVSQFLNTGSEAAERAITFAIFRHKNQIRKRMKDLAYSLNDIRSNMLDGNVVIPAESKVLLSRFIGKELDGLSVEFIAEYLLKVEKLLKRSISFVSLTGSYHGQTLGSLQLSSSIFGDLYSSGAINVSFCSGSDVDGLKRVFGVGAVAIPTVSLVGNTLVVEETMVNTIAGFILETLQGEGGVIEVTKDFFDVARSLCREVGATLIVDEIQSGCGRTGRFLHSEKFGLHADCYLFGKALGGGITKISACSFERSIYDPEFDVKLGSTYAEDEISCSVALTFLSSLFSNSALLNDIQSKGQTIVDELRRISERFPGIIKWVRGEGLFIGVEFHNHAKRPGFIFRAMSESDNFAYGVASYMFYAHNVRVAAFTGNNHTIRIQPSCFITRAEISHLVESIARVCEVIYKLDGFEFCQHLIARNKADTERKITDCRELEENVITEEDKSLRSVSFIVTPSKINDLVDVDPTLKRLSASGVRKLWERFYNVIGGVTVQQSRVSSIKGVSVNFRLASLPFDVERIIKLMFNGENEVMNKVIEDDIDRVVSEGYEYYGLGAFTSIVSNNGKRFVRNDINITTGNSLTVYMGIKALFRQAETQKISVAGSKCAVFGALGNIGSVYAKMMADECKQILLVGRPGSDERLKKLACEIYDDAIENLRNGKTGNGISKGLYDNDVIRRGCLDGSLSGERLCELLGFEDSADALVTISTQPSSLRSAALILACSNSPKALITKESLSENNTAICDVSFPPDVHDDVKRMDNVGVISGGLVKLPCNPDLKLRGSPELPTGCVYACVAETIVLGMSNYEGHYSYGSITKNQVYEIGRMAEEHGFVLSSGLENKY